MSVSRLSSILLIRPGTAQQRYLHSLSADVTLQVESNKYVDLILCLNRKTTLNSSLMFGNHFDGKIGIMPGLKCYVSYF